MFGPFQTLPHLHCSVDAPRLQLTADMQMLVRKAMCPASFMFSMNEHELTLIACGLQIRNGFMQASAANGTLTRNNNR